MKDNWEFIAACIKVMEATDTDAVAAKELLLKHKYLIQVKEPLGAVAILPGKTDTMWHTYVIRTDKGRELLTNLLFNKVTRLQAIKEIKDLLEADCGKEETNENV